MARSKSLSDEVIEVLKTEILEGKIQSGQKMPTEIELIERFDVSRTVIREAISHLRASGFVSTKHGIGTFVCDLENRESLLKNPIVAETVKDVLSLLELRISLESEAAFLAAQRRTPEQLERMQEYVSLFEHNLEKGLDTLEPDFNFHLTIAQATDNKYFIDFLRYLGSTVIPRARVNTAKLSDDLQYTYLKKVHQEHLTILQAIREQKTSLAASAMRSHLSNSSQRLSKAQELIKNKM